jgi:carbon-monoxide dehydrogenase medium subunit
MGSVPVRATAVEQALVGQPATGDAIRTAAAAAADGTTPPVDANADADYRRHLAGVLTRRALEAASAG